MLLKKGETCYPMEKLQIIFPSWTFDGKPLPIYLRSKETYKASYLPYVIKLTRIIFKQKKKKKSP